MTTLCLLAVGIPLYYIVGVAFITWMDHKTDSPSSPLKVVWLAVIWPVMGIVYVLALAVLAPVLFFQKKFKNAGTANSPR